MEATAFPVLTYPKLSKSTSLSLGEHVYVPPNSSSKMLLCQRISFMNKRVKFRSIKSFCIRAIDEDEKVHRSSDKQASRERLLALLKHIKDSISEDDSRSKNKTPQTLDVDSSDRTPVVDFFRPDLDTKFQSVNAKGDIELSPSRITADGDKPAVVPNPKPSTDNELFQLPSKSLKNAPVQEPQITCNVVAATNSTMPSSEATEAANGDQSNGAMPSTGAAIELLQLDAMKLGELKELAKEKGIRGYSKLKKSELVELLKSQVSEADGSS